MKPKTNSKDRKILLILLLAVIFAVACGVAIYIYLTPQKTTMYVFRDNYKAGQIITDDILTPVTADAQIVVAGNAQNASTIFVTGDNRRQFLDTKQNSLRMDVAKGMPLTQAMLTVDGGSYIEMTMNDKKVAVTVPVGSVSGVTDDLSEGSRVNIYATGAYSGVTGTTLIFENMRVLSVSKSENGTLTAATIETTPEESLKLINAANNSVIYFGLINSAGYETTGEEDMFYTTDEESQDLYGVISDYGYSDSGWRDETEETVIPAATEEQPKEKSTEEKTDEQSEENTENVEAEENKED